MLQIRKAEEKDVDVLLRIFDRARAYMRDTGNPTQWREGYPSESSLRKDMAEGNCYCVVDPAGRVVGTFALVSGEDPNYQKMYAGSWLNDRPYATIHRLAADGSCRGVADACFSWVISRCDNLRADTHADNKILQHILGKYGFVYCGIVHVANGTERLAYQRTAEALLSDE